jgi:hypothetical protein
MSRSGILERALYSCQRIQDSQDDASKFNIVFAVLLMLVIIMILIVIPLLLKILA